MWKVSLPSRDCHAGAHDVDLPRDIIEDLQAQRRAAHLEAAAEREKLRLLESEIASAKTENDSLRAVNADLKAGIAQFSSPSEFPAGRIERRSHGTSIDSGTAPPKPSGLPSAILYPFTQVSVRLQLPYSGGKAARHSANRRARIDASSNSGHSWHGDPGEVMRQVCLELQHCNEGLRYAGRKLRADKNVGFAHSELIASYGTIRSQLNDLQSSWATLPPKL